MWWQSSNWDKFICSLLYLKQNWFIETYFHSFCLKPLSYYYYKNVRFHFFFFFKLDPLLLFLLVVILPLAELLIIHQVSEWLWGDGHHIGEDEAAVTAGRQHQLVMAVVVADAPHPGTKKIKHVSRYAFNSAALWEMDALKSTQPCTICILNQSQNKALCGWKQWNYYSVQSTHTYMLYRQATHVETHTQSCREPVCLYLSSCRKCSILTVGFTVKYSCLDVFSGANSGIWSIAVYIWFSRGIMIIITNFMILVFIVPVSQIHFLLLPHSSFVSIFLFLWLSTLFSPSCSFISSFLLSPLC